MKYITEKEALAMNLLNLVKHHKNNCNESDCGVSLSAFRTVYEEWVGRKTTDEESQYFF